MNKSKNWQIKLLWLIGLAPLLLAWTMSLTGWGVPSETKNHGDLVKPALKVPQTVNMLHEGRWGLMYLSNSCDEICEKKLILMQQVHKALGKEFSRLQSLWIKGEGHELFPPREDLVSELDSKSIIAWFEKNNLPAFDHSIWLIDPEGNLVLRYSQDISGKDMLQDIRWLLKVSRIG